MSKYNIEVSQRTKNLLDSLMAEDIDYRDSDNYDDFIGYLCTYYIMKEPRAS